MQTPDMSISVRSAKINKLPSLCCQSSEQLPEMQCWDEKRGEGMHLEEQDLQYHEAEMAEEF